MNILYLDATRGLYGASRALLTLLESLDRERYKPYVVLANDVADGDLRLCWELERLSIPYREYPLAVLRRRKYLNPRGALFIANSLRRSVPYLRALIRKRRIDLVQTNTGTVLSGAVAARLAGVPHVWHVHEIFRAGEGLFFGTLIHALSSCVVANSQATARNLAHNKPALRPKLAVIENGINVGRFRSVRQEDIERVKSQWSISCKDLVVGMVGRIGTWKGEEQFIEVARLIAKRRQNVKFVIVGDTFDNQRRPIERAKALIASSGLANRVVLAGRRDDMPAVVSSFDVLLHLPMRPEPFGLVVVEAMAAGKPVVAASTGGLVEIIKDGETGYLVEPGDARQAADKVIALLDDHSLKERMGQAGARRADAEFTAAKYALRFEALYQGVTSDE